MTRVEELRIGICSCTNFYHGQLKNHVISIPEIPISLSISETVIREETGKQRPSIRQNRPHLFLDMHPASKGFNTELAIINLYPNTRERGDQVFIGSAIQNKQSLEKRWYAQPRPPTIDELLESIPKLVLIQGQERFERWLIRMTPKSWVISEQVKTTASGLCVVNERVK